MAISRSLRLPVLSVALAGLLCVSGASAQDATDFAHCIADSGAVFYGAHWCPYCAKQKAAFGRASSHLPYVECYRAGTREKLSRCDHIKRFPSWQLRDGTIHTGLKSFEKLARLTGCRLP